MIPNIPEWISNCCFPAKTKHVIAYQNAKLLLKLCKLLYIIIRVVVELLSQLEGMGANGTNSHKPAISLAHVLFHVSFNWVGYSLWIAPCLQRSVATSCAYLEACLPEPTTRQDKSPAPYGQNNPRSSWRCGCSPYSGVTIGHQDLLKKTLK